MEHHATINALLITEAEANDGIGAFNVVEQDDGEFQILDGSHTGGTADTLSDALRIAEECALEFDVHRLMRGRLPLADAEEIGTKMGDMIAPVLHNGPMNDVPIFSRSEAETYIRNRIDPPECVVLTMSSREYDAMLAGLRLLATAMKERLVLADDDDIGQILTCGMQHPGLTDEQVHDLADAFQRGDRDPR